MTTSPRRGGGLAAVAIVAAGLLASVPAEAGLFGPKSSREVMPAREVERPLDMPRGWSEFTFGHKAKIGTGRFDSDGSIVP